MKSESFIELINDGNFYALYKIPDVGVKLVKDRLDYTAETFDYFNRDVTYGICTNLYECEDGYVMVSGVCYIEEDTYALPKDIGVKCRAILCRFQSDEEIVEFVNKYSEPKSNISDMSRWLPKGTKIEETKLGDTEGFKKAVDVWTQERINDMMKAAEPEPKHPDYYKGSNKDGKAIEVFDIIDQFVDGDFYLGNVLKYVCRAGKKSKETKRQDLEKALHYIKEAIKRI